MTNYYVNVQSSKHNTFVNDERSGNERYEILKHYYPSNPNTCTMQDMANLMKRVKFSLAYSDEGRIQVPYNIDEPKQDLAKYEWYSEMKKQSFIETYNEASLSEEWQKTIEDLNNLKIDYKKAIQEERRAEANPKFWHTTHNSTYDISNGDLWVIAQEKNYSQPYKFHIDFKK